MSAACVLCTPSGEQLVWQGDLLRVIRAQEAGFPAFYRVIWNAHVAEWTDLPEEERIYCMEAVARVELALREHVAPDKINLAALGNMVPHLHWHVIARFVWDSHFPSPVWAPAVRERDLQQEDTLHAQLSMVDAQIQALLNQL